MKRKNDEIRLAAATAGVRLWQIADALGIADSSFSRKLREDLSEADKETILDIINKLSKKPALGKPEPMEQLLSKDTETASVAINGWKYDGPPLRKIPAAAEITGLSKYWLREQARAGKIPCIRAGNIYYINIPKLLEQLGANSDETDEK